MYVSNRANFGHLLSLDGFETTHLFNEMWQLTENRWDWEQRYLHVNYSQALAKDFKNEMVSVDTYQVRGVVMVPPACTGVLFC